MIIVSNNHLLLLCKRVINVIPYYNNFAKSNFHEEIKNYGFKPFVGYQKLKK